MRTYGMKSILCFLLAFICAMPMAKAEVQTFSAIGEYTMSDYETPEVAEQRAIAYAKQRAAEQAGVYVETYTRMEKMQLTEDVVKSITGGVMEVTSKKTSKKALQTGDIRIIAEITAKVDTQDIERSLREKGKKRATLAERYKSLQQAIAKQERENDELKQKIAELKAKALPVQDLQIEAKVKEREFLSNQKVDEGIPYVYKRNYLK